MENEKNEKIIPSKIQQELIEDFVKKWDPKYSPYKKDITVRTYQTELELFNSYCMKNYGSGLDTITSEKLKRYFSQLSENKDYKPATIKKKFTALKTYVEFIGEGFLMDGIKIKSDEKPDEEKYKFLEKKQVLEMLHLFEEHGKNRNEKAKRKKEKTKEDQYKKNYWRDRAILMTFVYTGLRVFELEKMDRVKVGKKDYDYIEWTAKRTAGMMHVLGKKDKRRKVPFGKNAADALNDYLETRDDDNPALFLSTKGERLSKRAIQDVVENAGKLIGIERLGTHQLRHTYGSLNMKKGMKVTELAALMGHDNLATTSIYAKSSLKGLGKKTDSLLDGTDDEEDDE